MSYDAKMIHNNLNCVLENGRKLSIRVKNHTLRNRNFFPAASKECCKKA
jgi:hypothetical protein